MGADMERYRRQPLFAPLNEINVTGAKQLFWGDLHSESRHFQPLFSFLATDVVFVENRRRLDVLPRQSRAGILSIVATFLPFYDNVMVSHAPHS